MDNINSNFNNNFDEDDSFSLKQEFFKYFYFWKYFLFSIFLFLFSTYFYILYTPIVYKNNAKIQILDKKQNGIKMPSADDFFSKSSINLENEIELITSSSILKQVIENINLNIYVEGVGDIMTSRILSYPFLISTKNELNKTKKCSFSVELVDDRLSITNLTNDKTYSFKDYSTNGDKHDLPFELNKINKENWIEDSYKINFIPTYDLINNLKKTIVVSQIGKDSEILNIEFNNSNPEYAKVVLNEIVDVFNNDGVKDRRLIHKRTIDFVNDRYSFLASELDSIEVDKKTFKIKNNLVDLNVNSAISLEKNSLFEDNIFSNENQIFITSNLLEELLNLNFDLLPSNIGVENIEINSLISSYNKSILEQRKLIISAGPNNPFVKQLNNSIIDSRNNIISSLQNYLQQLNILKNKLVSKSNDILDNVANIPGQEKNLRAIERNQKIKEELYLFLLQKGEEAQVSYAVTEPSIKVIDYAITSSKPISPKKNTIYTIAFFLSLLLPFSIIYLIFLFDNKIHSREDLENSKYKLNILGEIPFFDSDDEDKIFSAPTDRSIVSESFRMLMSNVRYFENLDTKSNVLVVTSSIKGEGKTLNALNLSLSFASVGKKVLLIGCDLRNPQLHKYVNLDKNTPGLVDYLVDNKIDWKKNTLQPFDKNQNLEILLSGPLPPNPLHLVNNGNLNLLLEEAREEYDYIIIDSAPTLLVADTKSIFDMVDTVIFLTRCNVTDKEILNHISDISNEISGNVGVVLNGVGAKNAYGYSYGYSYKYGYGYNYKYSYNYGYGYGYGSDEEKS